MRSIPGMVVISPADGVETKAAIRAVAAYDGPCYVRLGRMAVEDVYTEDTLNFQIGKGNVIRKGNGVAPVSYTHLDVYKRQVSFLCRHRKSVLRKDTIQIICF